MKTNNQSGFTLIEVMMVIVLGSIIITLAIPGFRSFIQNNRIVTQTNGLVTSLILARSEAIKRGTRVSVCASSDSSSCSGSTNWANGWIVFTDNGTAGSFDGTDFLIRVSKGVNNSITMQVDGASYIRYKPTGFLANNCTDCVNDFTHENPTEAGFSMKIANSLLNLLPINLAQASSDSGSSSSGSSSSGSSSSGSSSSGSSSSGSSSSGSSSSGSSGSGCSSSSGSSGSSSSGSSGSGSSSSGSSGSGSSSSGSSGSGSSSSGSSGSGSSSSGSSGSGSSSSGSSGSGSSSSGSSSSGSSSSGSSSSGSSGSSSGGCNSGGSSPSGSTVFKVCDSSRSGEKGKKVTVTVIGRISTASITCD